MKIYNIEQRSFEWYQLRSGKVTGTSLKSALGSPSVQRTLMYKLISEKMTETKIDDIVTPAILRGRELEPFALIAAEKELNIKFNEVGFLAHDSLDFGMSPDGVCYENKEIIGGIEIKCPNSEKHIEYLLNNKLPSAYEFQVMAPFILSDSIKFWFFASYDDSNYQKPLFIIKIDRPDDDKINSCRNKLEEFLFQVNKAHLSLIF